MSSLSLALNKIFHNILFVESYDAEPNCAPAGSISGFTFINFVLSAASVAANLVSNANSNNNNNNNNNNDNNDNVNNINVANNNNAGNNVNDIQICPFPCLPQPPPIIMKRKKRNLLQVGSLTFNFLNKNKTLVEARSDLDDIKIVTMLLTDIVTKLDKHDIDKNMEDFLINFGRDLAKLNIGFKG